MRLKAEGLSVVANFILMPRWLAELFEHNMLSWRPCIKIRDEDIVTAGVKIGAMRPEAAVGDELAYFCPRLISDIRQLDR